MHRSHLVVLKAGGWNAIRFNTPTAATYTVGSYPNLSFWINGGAIGGIYVLYVFTRARLRICGRVLFALGECVHLYVRVRVYERVLSGIAYDCVLLCLLFCSLVCSC